MDSRFFGPSCHNNMREVNADTRSGHFFGMNPTRAHIYSYSCSRVVKYMESEDRGDAGANGALAGRARF